MAWTSDESFARLETADNDDGEHDGDFTASEGEGADDQGRTPPLVWVAFIFPALAGLNFGYDIGATGGALQQLRLGGGAVLDSSPVLLGLLTSGSLAGAVMGIILSFLLAGPLGRRGELLLGAALYMAGTLITCYAPRGADLLTHVLVGRLIYGMGFAFCMHAAPVYIAETSTPSTRGLLVSLKEGFIVFGILLGFGASAAALACSLPHWQAWRYIWAPPALLSFVVFLGMLPMPESPRWLVVRAKAEAGGWRDGASELADAAHALRRLRSSTLCGPPQCEEQAIVREVSIHVCM